MLSGRLQYTTVRAAADKGLKVVADGLKKGELAFDLYYKNGLKDKVRAEFDKSASDILKSYGAFAVIDNLTFFDDHVHLKFKTCKTQQDVASVIQNAIKSGATSFTVNYESGAMAGVTNINDLLISNGLIVMSAKATIKSTSAVITLTPFSTIDSLKTTGMAAARKAAVKGVDTLTFFYKESLYKEVNGNLLSIMTSNGICGRTIAGIIDITCASVKMLPYETAKDLLNYGIGNAAKSIGNGSMDNIVIYYTKGLKSKIDCKLGALLQEKGVCVANVSGYVGDERATFSVVPYESLNEVTGYGIPAAAAAAKSGLKELTICYKSGLKSSVQSKFSAEFASLMKKSGANVTVKSITYYNDHVNIVLA